MREGRAVEEDLVRGGGIGSSMDDIGVSLSLSRDCWLSLSAVVTVSWLSSTKTEMDFLVLSLGFQPSKSGSDRRASSRESSDSRYASLLAFLGLLRGFGTGKNLLFSGDTSLSPISFSSHKRAFLGGRAGASVEGSVGESYAVTCEDERLGVGLPGKCASILEMGSVRRRCRRGEVRVRPTSVRLEAPGRVGWLVSSR